VYILLPQPYSYLFFITCQNYKRRVVTALFAHLGAIGCGSKLIRMRRASRHALHYTACYSKTSEYCSESTSESGHDVSLRLVWQLPGDTDTNTCHWCMRQAVMYQVLVSPWLQNLAKGCGRVFGDPTSPSASSQQAISVKTWLSNFTPHRVVSAVLPWATEMQLAVPLGKSEADTFLARSRA